MKFQARLTLAEAHAIAETLGLSWERFREEYTDPRWPGTKSLLIRHYNERCIFLQPSGDTKQFLCSIQAFKPSCCKEWKPGWRQAECREGLKKRWNLTLDESGQVSGNPADIESFQSFIKGLAVEEQ